MRNEELCCFRETKRYVYEKDLFSLCETNNFQSLLCSFVNAQKDKETYSLLVQDIRDVIADAFDESLLFSESDFR